MNFDFAFVNLHANGSRTFIGELRDAFDGGAQFFALQNHGVRMILRQHALEIREIAGQLAAQQQALADCEEQVVIVAGELTWPSSIDRPGQFQNLAHGLASAAAPGTEPLSPASALASPPWPAGDHRSQPSTSPCLFKSSSAPFSVKRDSSRRDGENASCEIICESRSSGICASTSGISGSSGKLSRDIPAMRVRDRPQTKLAHWFSCQLHLDVGIRQQTHVIQAGAWPEWFRRPLFLRARGRRSECPIPDQSPSARSDLRLPPLKYWKEWGWWFSSPQRPASVPIPEPDRTC